jgi:hypothetical protein
MHDTPFRRHVRLHVVSATYSDAHHRETNSNDSVKKWLAKATFGAD